MKLEKTIYLNQLFDLYGTLLTDKQQQIFKCYYFDDISLSEIAQINQVSKQAVKDCLDKTEKILVSYESKTKLFEKQQKIEAVLKDSPKLFEQVKKIWKES